MVVSVKRLKVKWLRGNLGLWERRLRFRRARAAHWRRVGSRSRLAHWQGLAEHAERMVARRRRQIAEKTWRPRIIDLGVSVDALWGALGPLVGSVGHYTAGPRDTSDEDALRLFRLYHAEHRGKGWGGIGYHFGITRAGSIVLLRPAWMKGAHVAGANTGRIGIVCHGTTGDLPTAAQQRALRWLLANAHTTALPKAHRASAPLAELHAWAHNDLNSTSCPGSFKRMYTSKGRTR